MASDDPRKEYRRELDTLDRFADEGKVSADDREAIREFLKAKDPEDMSVSDPEGDAKQPSTLAAYSQALRLVSTRSDRPLVEATVQDLNQLMTDCREGDVPGVKDSGLSKNTLSQHQSALRKFYRYHADLGVNPEEIVLLRPERKSVDERDMFTREEIEAMRDVITNPRDRCIFELLVNTGQRVRVIQTLRVKDVKPNEGGSGVFYLNDEIDGLKGADKNGKKRPLLGAKRAVYDWLQYHPTGNPDDYLITIRPSANRGTPGETLHQTTIGGILKRIAEDADIDDWKNRSNAHLFRHHFVTVAKRDYDLDNDTIKHLIGHSPDSRVMETTYQHLTDEDYINRVEVATGDKEPEESGNLTPSVCPTCGENLTPGAKACPGCGTVFAPDAKAVKEQVEDDLWDDKSEAEGAEEDAVDELKKLLRDNPGLLGELSDSAE